MRIHPLLASVLLICSAAPALPAAEVKSPITAVTVYLDRALVTRTAEVRCAPGRNEILLAGLPAELADSSIRVSAERAAVRGVRVERVFLERAEAAEIRRMEDELRLLRDSEQGLRDDLAVLEGEAKFLRGIQAFVPERAVRMTAEGDMKLPDVAGCEKMLEFTTRALNVNASKARDANMKLRDLAPKIETRSKDLAEKRSGGRLENKNVTIVLEAAEAAEAKVGFSYLLPGAMWFPAYDVRADLEAGEMELAYYAIIQQATGEEWSGVDLTLSANRPAERSAKPLLAPWLLGGVPLPRGSNASPQAQMEAQQSQEDLAPQIRNQLVSRAAGQKAAHSNLLENESQVMRLFRGVAARGTSVAFPVPTRESVRSDGKPHQATIAVERFKLAAEYEAVPALSLATYVTGKAVNTGKLPLLPGDAGVYLGGDLIGTGRVEFVAPGEETSFYLGVDETVKVTRRLDSKLSSIRSSGKRQRVEAAYSITVENFKKSAVAVRVEEALPVSQDSEVAVRIRTLEPEPAAGTGEGERGLAKWRLNLPAGGKQTVNLAYTIEYPIEMIQRIEASPAAAREFEWIRNAK